MRVVVTGANRGIGKEIVRQLAEQEHEVWGTGRTEAAVESVAESCGAHAFQLDVGDDSSVAAFAQAWGDRELDVLINNAGVSLRGFDADVVARTMAVNYRGAVRCTEALLPRLADRARVIMMSSGLGELAQLGPSLRARFAADDLRRADIDGLVDGFEAAVRAGRHRADGWSSSAYGVSKVAMNAYARVLARSLAGRAFAYAMCPGWVRTDMGGAGAPRSVAEGADTAVWLATAAPAPPTGRFYRDRRAVSF